MSAGNGVVEVVGHATLRVRSGGATLLTDPWLVDPIVSIDAFHWPPLVHRAAQIAADTTAIFISHPHPDHRTSRPWRSSRARRRSTSARSAAKASAIACARSAFR